MVAVEPKQVRHVDSQQTSLKGYAHLFAVAQLQVYLKKRIPPFTVVTATPLLSDEKYIEPIVVTAIELEPLPVTSPTYEVVPDVKSMNFTVVYVVPEIVNV